MEIFVTQPDDACARKNAYDSENLARSVGRTAMKERGINLYVYKCHRCYDWHLTRTYTGKHCHVSAPFTTLDDFMSPNGDDLFWKSVDSASVEDGYRKLHLKRKRLVDAMERYDGRKSETVNRLAASLRPDLLAKKDALSRTYWLKAVAALLGDDAVPKVQVEIARLKAQAQIHGDCASSTRFPAELSARAGGMAIPNIPRNDLSVST